MPDPGTYEQEELPGTVVREIAKMTPRDQVQAALRPLLDDRSTGREVGGDRGAGRDEVGRGRAPRSRRSRSSKERLIGFWGERTRSSQDPTLGQRAKELADQLLKRPK